MGYIYRYHLRNETLRDEIILNGDTISEVLQALFGIQIKEIHIEDHYFEVKLYNNERNQRFRIMGKKLASVLETAGWPYGGGFKRMSQEFYGIAYLDRRDSEDDTVDVEFYDCMDMDALLEELQESRPQFDNRDGIIKRSALYAQSFRQNFDVDSTLDDRMNPTFYIDIYKGNINYKVLQQALDIKDGDERREIIFKVEGSIKSQYDMERLWRYRPLKDEDRASWSLLSGDTLDIWRIYDDNFLEDSPFYERDWIHLIRYAKTDQKLLDRIKAALPALLDRVDMVPELVSITPDDDYSLRVHAVGAAQAVSVTRKGDEIPVFYFDFGKPVSKHMASMPHSPTTEIGEETAIIISHLHEDHWGMLTLKAEAFKCNWYLPDQPLSGDLRKRIVEIIAAGGMVKYLASSHVFPIGEIIYQSVPCSRYTSVRKKVAKLSSHVHETGFCLCLNLTCDRQYKDIFVAGDQRYDFVDDGKLKDHELLIASHHGGSYVSFAGKRQIDYIPVPADGASGTGSMAVGGDVEDMMLFAASLNMEPVINIVYSCGFINKKPVYGHPSKAADYQEKGWKNEHRTSIAGDYSWP